MLGQCAPARIVLFDFTPRMPLGQHLAIHALVIFSDTCSLLWRSHTSIQVVCRVPRLPSDAFDQGDQIALRADVARVNESGISTTEIGAKPAMPPFVFTPGARDLYA